MKIFKKDNVSLLIKPFGLADSFHLALTLLYYFDLNDPDTLFKEQDLWKDIPEQLGSQPLDMGFPKPRGEFLLTGSCFSPRGSSRQASQVTVRAGSIEKTVNVYGNRYWKDQAGLAMITKAESFTEMPLTYPNAFGGHDYPLNSVGKGIDPLVKDDQLLYPLPNIEYPDELVGSPEDRPRPAGFGPLDVLWQPRSGKTGTFDQKWQNERWPYFPDDLNYEFFNMAPEDQWLPDFFSGQETMGLLNLHPDFQVINSRLPRIRPRCFVTKKKDLKARDEIFEEVKTRLDTLWLFPSLLKGLVMFRGTTRLLDEEYVDVLRVFLATEKPDRPPKSIDEYYEEQQKAANLDLKIDPAPFEAAQKQIEAAYKQIRNISQDLELAKKEAMNQAPRMPYTLSEIASTTKKTIADNLAMIDKAEAGALKMNEKFGHFVPVNLEMFGQMRNQFKGMAEKLDQTFNHLEKARQQLAEGQQQALEQASQALKKHVPPPLLEQAGIDPDNLDFGFQTQVNPWHDRGFPLVVQSCKTLLNNPQLLDQVRASGLDLRTIKQAWIGFNPEEKTDDPILWGLEPELDAQGQPQPLVVPAGLVLPRFDQARLTRLVIRPLEFEPNPNDSLIRGSDPEPLFLSTGTPAPMVLVGDELEARLLFQEIGDFCSVAVLNQPQDKLGEEATKSLKSAPILLIVMAPNQISQWPDWVKVFDQGVRLELPLGQNLFQAHRNGVNIRQWVLEALPDELGRPHLTPSVVPKPGQPPGKFNLVLPFSAQSVKKMVDQAIEEVMAFHQPKIKEMQALQGKLMDQAKDRLTEMGLNAREVLDAAQKTPPKSFEQVGREASKKIIDQKDHLRAMNLIGPDQAREMTEAAERIKKMGLSSQERFDSSMARLETSMKQVAASKSQLESGALPDDVRAKLEEFGVDPEKYQKRTREEVIVFHREGLSLVGANLSGEDLSGLDLTGVDLSEANCQGTNFHRTILDRAIFKQTMAMEADFSKASLQETIFERAMLMEAKFKKAKLKGVRLHQTICQGADFTKASLDHSEIDMSILEKAKMIKTGFKQAKISMSMFNEADCYKTNWTEACLHRCLFKGTKLDKAVFPRAQILSTMFFEAHGKKITFIGANLEKTSLANHTVFPLANFHQASLKGACFRDSDLTQSQFQDSILDEALVENCNLIRTSLFRASAQKTRFNKTNLEGADLRAINLFQGSLRKCRLVRADLSLSNLFGVDFFKAVVGQTKFDQANLKRSQLFDRVDLLE